MEGLDAALGRLQVEGKKGGAEGRDGGDAVWAGEEAMNCMG